VPDRCPYHDDLVVAVGQLSVKIDALHEDIHEIKTDLYEAGNGGAIGWIQRTRGAKSVKSSISLAVWAFFISLVTVAISEVIRNFV
jgi:hypothetical protein